MPIRIQTQVERIASLEAQVTILAETQKEMNGKLDELLAMRNKGLGVFWLASTILGTGIFGFAIQIVAWMRK